MKKLLVILLPFFLISCEQYDKKWQIDEAIENCADTKWMKLIDSYLQDGKVQDRLLGRIIDPFEMKIKFEGYKNEVSICKEEFSYSENQRRFVKKWLKKCTRARIANYFQKKEPGRDYNNQYFNTKCKF